MRLLYLKDSTLKEVLDEMKAVYGEDVPSYDVVKHWHMVSSVVSSSAVVHQWKRY